MMGMGYTRFNAYYIKFVDLVIFQYPARTLKPYCGYGAELKMKILSDDHTTDAPLAVRRTISHWGVLVGRGGLLQTALSD